MGFACSLFVMLEWLHMESVDTSVGCSVGEEKTGVTSFGSERPSHVGAVDVITLHIWLMYVL